MLQKYRTLVLPLAMILGFFFHHILEKGNLFVPYLLFAMLLITLCSVNLKEIRFTWLNVWLLVVQIVISIIVFWILQYFNFVLAEGAMMCILAPTANSTVVIGGLLGGNKTTITTHTLICNVAVAIEAPILFSLIGSSEINFLDSFYSILAKILPVLVGPLILAILLHLFVPKVHAQIKKWQNISFYLWGIALTIVIGRTVNFMMAQDQSSYLIEIYLIVISLIICILQFLVGRVIGRKFRDTIAGGQLLGQKNTALAIWMTQSYLNPIASVAPATYAIWQNVINSYQLFLKKRREKQSEI